MSFLVGIVIAQQGAVQLEQFGAQIYTVNPRRICCANWAF
jgi:phospholipid/cholesterol/gamma-HCH transport system permease protein